MKSRYTLVLEFDEGKEPALGFNQEVLGGNLVAAAFFDYRDDMLNQSELDSLEEVICESEDSDAWGEYQVDSDEVIKKLRLLVI